MKMEKFFDILKISIIIIGTIMIIIHIIGG